MPPFHELGNYVPHLSPELKSGSLLAQKLSRRTRDNPVQFTDSSETTSLGITWYNTAQFSNPKDSLFWKFLSSNTDLFPSTQTEPQTLLGIPYLFQSFFWVTVETVFCSTNSRSWFTFYHQFTHETNFPVTLVYSIPKLILLNIPINIKQQSQLILN